MWTPRPGMGTASRKACKNRSLMYIRMFFDVCVQISRDLRHGGHLHEDYPSLHQCRDVLATS